jgi:hypothetical protein
MYTNKVHLPHLQNEIEIQCKMKQLLSEKKLSRKSWSLFVQKAVKSCLNPLFNLVYSL